MPYTRLFAIIFVFILLTLAFMGPRDSSWFSCESLWISVLLAIFVLFISLMRNFLLDVTVCFFMAFFLQRIVTLYFFPDTFECAKTIKLNPEVFISTLWFIFACLFAVWIGYLLFRAVALSSQQNKDSLKSDNNKIFGNEVLFSRFFRFYTIFAVLSFVFRQILETVFKAGVYGLPFDRCFAVSIRIAALINGLSFLAFIPLLKKNSDPKDRKLAMLLIILQLIGGVLSSSKAAFLGLILNFIVCLFFIKGRVPARYIRYTVIILVFTMLIYAPLITIISSAKVTAVKTGKGFKSDVITDYFTSERFKKPSFAFLARMGGLDWLLGFMAAGRDKFPSYVSLKGDMVDIVNSLVPGDIIDISNQISPRHIIPIILRGYREDDIASWGGHGENFGIVGMVYVYFGLLGGPLFFLIWSFLSLKIIYSRIGIIIKILYFQCFVTTLMVGGYLGGVIISFYEGILMIGLIFMFAKIMPKFKRSKLSY